MATHYIEIAPRIRHHIADFAAALILREEMRWLGFLAR